MQTSCNVALRSVNYIRFIAFDSLKASNTWHRVALHTMAPGSRVVILMFYAIFKACSSINQSITLVIGCDINSNKYTIKADFITGQTGHRRATVAQVKR